MSILHADNPTTSLGHPHKYSGNFLRFNTTLSPIENEFLLDGSWLLDNDLIVTQTTYMDKWLGLDHHQNDEITQILLNDDNQNETTSTNLFFNGRSHFQLRHLCRQVLTQKIPEIGVRYWDATIFLVNFLFFMFLITKLICVCGRRKQKQQNSMFKEFYVLIFVITLLNMGHAIGSASLSLTNQLGSLIDQILWFCLKFAMFTTELCILFFGLCFGQSSSTRSVCCGLFAATLFSVIHAALQSLFDFRLWDEYVNLDFLKELGYEQELNFWVVSSALIGLCYLLIGFVPLFCCRQEPCLLHRCSFFVYCLLLSLLNFAQSLGALLIRLECADGLCIADIVTLCYFTLFGPIVYLLFLRPLVKTRRATGGLFSYRTHKNDPSSEANGYYPRFSGLISPSYDDLFDYDRIMQQQDNRHMENILHLNYDFYHTSGQDPHNIPLMMTRTPDSTLTTHMDSDPSGNGLDPDMSTTSESRPIIRAPYTSNSTFAQQQSRNVSYKPKNLQVRPDGQLTFSTTSTSSQ